MDLFVSFFWCGRRSGRVVKIGRTTVTVAFATRTTGPKVRTRSIHGSDVQLTGRSTDEATRQVTAFASFSDLVNAKGGYRPTLMGDGLQQVLANTYDAFQKARGDERRAFRGTSPARRA